MEVAVTGRTREQVEAVADEIGGRALVGDVSRREDVEALVRRARRASTSSSTTRASPGAPAPRLGRGSRRVVARVRGQRARRVPLLPCGAAGDDRARPRADRQRQLGGRVPRRSTAGVGLGTAYGASKAALSRFTEALDAQAREHGVRAFHISPGMVRTEMTAPIFGDDAPWTPPELAPAARPGARVGPRRRARRPLHPRRARRHRGADRARRRGDRRRPERDPVAARAPTRSHPKPPPAHGDSEGSGRRRAALCRKLCRFTRGRSPVFSLWDAARARSDQHGRRRPRGEPRPDPRAARGGARRAGRPRPLPRARRHRLPAGGSPAAAGLRPGRRADAARDRGGGPRHGGARRLPALRPRPLQRLRRAARTARSRRCTGSASCPTTASSTRTATSPPAATSSSSSSARRSSGRPSARTSGSRARPRPTSRSPART